MADDSGTSAKRPTIYDLAQLAGSSPSAVSAILNGTWKKRRISPATADRVMRIAAEQGYAPNLQAVMLRRERSHVIGMIVPKYDNRYFGAIAEQFETEARARGLFPVITCTRRDPALEFEAAREMVSFQAECLVVTGATDPDRLADYCAAAGVRVINLDLPGHKAPSIVSDNYGAAREVTRRVLAGARRAFGEPEGLWFVGGRASDNNTAERLRGFRDAHAEAGVAVLADRIVTPGYSAPRVVAALEAARVPQPFGMFVNSTIAMEGVVSWLAAHAAPGLHRLGCFDWDPFAALMPQVDAMARQDVPAMLRLLFALIEDPAAAGGGGTAGRIEVPCLVWSPGAERP